MGGLGSGRPSSGAPTCEGCLGIDLAWLRRRGMLQLGRRSAVTWSRSGEQTGSITLAAQSDGVRLIYGTTDREGAPVDVDELIPFTYTPTMFGGRRQWLRCLKCGRGCRKIAKRLHDRWGGTTEEEYDFPPKPPRMRWATYNRLLEQYDGLENVFDRLRMSYGETRRLLDSPGHVFDRTEIEDGTSFLTIAALFLWDCFVVNQGSTKLLYLSHDEYGVTKGVDLQRRVKWLTIVS